MFTHRAAGEGILAITAPMEEQVFLVLGDRLAVVVDTGMGIGSLHGYLRRLTALPLLVVNTHGHPDHAGGNIEFGHCMMHRADEALFPLMCSRAYRLQDIRLVHGDTKPEYEAALLDMAVMPALFDRDTVLDLGGRTLSLHHSPGHTPGCVSLYDDLTDSLFAGDMLSAHEVWMYDVYSEPLAVYRRSIASLRDRFPAARQIFVGHLPCVLKPEALHAALTCADRILTGEGVGTPYKTFAGEGLFYAWAGFGIVYNPARLYS